MFSDEHAPANLGDGPVQVRFRLAAEDPGSSVYDLVVHDPAVLSEGNAIGIVSKRGGNTLSNIDSIIERGHHTPRNIAKPNVTRVWFASV